VFVNPLVYSLWYEATALAARFAALESGVSDVIREARPEAAVPPTRALPAPAAASPTPAEAAVPRKDDWLVAYV
jgi:hypothetical protein